MLDDIALFIQLIDVGSFSQLAELLDLTQATISRRIQGLEAELGVTLLKRNTKGFVISPEGRTLYDKFQLVVVNQGQALHSTREQLQNNSSATIRLAITTESIRHVLMPRLPEFIAQYPQVKFHIVSTTNSIHLTRQKYDLAVSSELPDSSVHKVSLLYKFQFKVYASPKYIAKYGEPKTVAELSQHKCIGSLDTAGKERHNYLVRNNITSQEEIIAYNGNVYMDYTSDAIALAKSGEYLTGAWDLIVQNELRSGELVPVLKDYIFWELPCYLVRSSGITNPVEQKLAEFIESLFTPTACINN